MANEIERVLSINEKDYFINKVIKHTTISAYRRIHEIVGTTLDLITDSVKETGKLPASALIDLSRGLIMVKYQNARKQLPDQLAIIVFNIIDNVLKKAKSANPTETAMVAERARALLDAIAVLVYRFGKRG